MTTHKQYIDLLSSGSALYSEAVRSIPPEDQVEFREASTTFAALSKEFIDKLRAIDPDEGYALIHDYLRVEDACKGRYLMLADAMYHLGKIA